MSNNLSQEVFWLVTTCLMTGLFWVPYIINRLYEHSPLPALWNPMPDIRPKAQWAERMMRAHENAVENLVIFAPLALIVEILKIGTEQTAVACMIYFIARAAHYVIFTLGIPLLRVVAFAIGVVSQVYLAIHILTF